jgi:hypothetical protein
MIKSQHFAAIYKGKSVHIQLNAHYFFLVLALVLGVLATLNVPSSPRFNLLAGSFTAFLLAVFFT